jgi:hypothetical protein
VLLQVMENTWSMLNLEHHFDHPAHHGWRTVFRLWVRAKSLRRHWPVLKDEFGLSFVQFLEREFPELRAAASDGKKS